MSQQPGARDILEARRHGSDVKWAARDWNPVAACIQPRKSSASSIKATVLHSSRLRHIIHQVSDEESTPPEELYRRVEAILEEMGYNREIPILRWLGLFTSKILKRLCSAIYVNEDTLLKVKKEMGRNPVLFVPTHRSYGDFILMSYVCFHYELDVPRIAAGMDFHGMALMGQILRDSCAFFMRRTFSQDRLYSETFSEYVQTLVTHGDAAVEFFIEGTRSRSAKSLMPKFGFLSMALKPFLTGLVPDISIVPVNISYDRCLEETLFAYELLGVPKPKESTRGFIKALSILKEDYGKVFINFGEPLSVAQALQGRVDRSLHAYGPLPLQDLTPSETRQVVGLAHEIVTRQRQLTTLTSFNVVAAVLNDMAIGAKGVCSMDHLTQEVRWLADIFRVLGASIDVEADDVERCVSESVRLHRALVCMCGDEVRLRHGQTHAPTAVGTRLRGCDLSPATMDTAVPFVMLQHYVNPCCFYIVSLCSHVFALKTATLGHLTKAELLAEYAWFRKVFAHEFVFYAGDLERDFNISLDHGRALDLLTIVKDTVYLSKNEKLVQFCIHFLAPFLPGYVTLAEILTPVVQSPTTESEMLKSAQAAAQEKLSRGKITHPANLSLDLLGNGIQSFASISALTKSRINGSMIYVPTQAILGPLQKKLDTMEALLPRGNIHQLSATMTSKL